MASQIIKKWIGDNQVDQEKILLDNNAGLKSKNAAGNAEVDLIKLDTNNKVVVTSLVAPSNDTDAATKKYVDDSVTGFISDTAYGAGWNGDTTHTASKNAIYDEMELAKGRITALEGVSAQLHKRTLDGTDITNEYIDLPYLAVNTNDFHVFADRVALHQGAGEDYTLSAVGGVTRITFLNDMVGAGSQKLAVGDSIYVRYKK